MVSMVTNYSNQTHPITIKPIPPGRILCEEHSGVIRGGGGGKKFPLPKLRHHFCLSKNDVIEVLREKSSPGPSFPCTYPSAASGCDVHGGTVGVTAAFWI